MTQGTSNIFELSVFGAGHRKSYQIISNQTLILQLMLIHHDVQLNPTYGQFMAPVFVVLRLRRCHAVAVEDSIVVVGGSCRGVGGEG